MSESNISPLAKRLAEENNVDWQRLMGSGPEGRVVERDVLEYLARVMAGEEAMDPTPEPLPEGMEAWPEDDVKGFQAAPASRAVSQESELDLAGFQQGVQTQAFDDQSVDDDMFELSMEADGDQPQSSPVSGFAASEFESNEPAFAHSEFAGEPVLSQDDDEDDLLEIDRGFDGGEEETHAASEAWEDAEAAVPEGEGVDDAPSISEDLFLFDDEEGGSDEPPVFAEEAGGEAVAGTEDDMLFDLDSEPVAFEQTSSSEEEAPEASLEPGAESPFSSVETGEEAELVIDAGDEAEDPWALPEAGGDTSAFETDSFETDSEEIDLAAFERELPGGGLTAEDDEDETFAPVDLDFDGSEPVAEPSAETFDQRAAESGAADAEEDDMLGFGETAPELEPASPEVDTQDIDEGDLTEPVGEALVTSAVAAATSGLQDQDEDALVEAEMSRGDQTLSGQVQLVSYGMLLRRHLDLTALSQAQVAVGRELGPDSPIPPTAFLLRAAAKALRNVPLGEQDSVALAVISEKGLGARVVQDAAVKGFGSLLGDIEAACASQTTELEHAALVVADMSEYEVDEAVLNAGAPVLTLGRVLYDSTEGRYRSTLSLSGDISAEQGSKFLGRVAELLDSPVQLVI